MGGRGPAVSADASEREFRLPDLGEGLTEAEVLTWRVAEGDEVVLNQPIVEVETAKAAVEIPSPFAGSVARLHAAEGEVVDVGAPLVTVRTGPAAPVLEQPAADTDRDRPDDPGADAADLAAAEPAPTTPAVPEPAASEPAAPEPAVPEPAVPEPAAPEPAAAEPAASEPAASEPAAAGATAAEPRREALLVGYGVRVRPARRRPRLHPAPPVVSPPATERPRAAPPVRHLARTRGVDLAGLPGSGPDGTVTRDDVLQASPAGRDPRGVAETAGAAADEGDRDAPVRTPVRGVRRATAQAMVTSAFTAPHVTEFLTVDVTPSLELRERLAARPDMSGVRVSPLLLVARALLLAVRRSPEVNASWDDDTQEVVRYPRVDLGIAAATPRGLLVPALRGADRLGLADLGRRLQDLVATAREGRTRPEDLRGGTITITNVGSLGVDTGTPILNPGEAAILCLGQVREQPWVHAGEIAVRSVVTLSLSFDHRLVDGELGSRVLADTGAVLADPGLAMAWG